MNSELLQWICAILLLAVTAGLIVFAWVKAIDGLLWVIKRLQGNAPGEHA
jgi:hypothetical protein